MTIGTLLVYFSAIFGLTSFIAAIRWARGNGESAWTFKMSYHAMTLALAAASVVLMVAILRHDFRFDYVIGYSSTEMPLIYLISAFWGGQQGTFLLWALMGALIGYPLFRKSSWEPATVMAFYTPTILFMVGLMLDSGANPFTLAARIPADGNGLNPLLQDPWMATHPPMVFLGYAAMTVPAVLAMAALIRSEETRWLDVGLRWSLIGFVSLGIGIILGGFWAYKVLGWGGFWGWDPVENASLVPWIVVTALIHGILVQKFTGSLRRTNLALALGGYLTVLYATFLTRSGVLADFSVHSFPKGSLMRWLVVIMLIALLTAVWGMLRRKGPEGKVIQWNAGWPFILSSTVVLFTISTAIVLIGTSWPILTSYNENPTVPGIPFYNATALPLYVLLLLLLGIGPFSSWQSKWNELNKRVFLSAGLALIATVAAGFLGGHGIKFLLLFFAASFALIGNLIRFVDVARIRFMNTGASIAHIGFALMLVGIVASSAWDREMELKLPLGHPVDAMDRVFTYRGHVDGSEPKDQWRVAVMKPGADETTALTTMYRFRSGGDYQIMRNPAILRTLGHDLYLAPLALETGKSEKPMILQKDEPVQFDHGTLTFLRFDTDNNEGEPGHMKVDAIVLLTHGEEQTELTLTMKYINGKMEATAIKLPIHGGENSIAMSRMMVDQGTIEILTESGSGLETLVVSVSHKPLMNLLWTGTILLLLGCTVAAIRRYIDKRAEVVVQTVVT
ncbi:MAG: cytochrome c biogenesis protein CcsA [Acidobacteria bacterium]|uniref:Cytochrome c biogenesis protein CcsA n=1 Tax=Candidatus Polarisedimenticola svalbardensis TaxID=2886004 RepID=A0A8J7CLH6_9BACT|nr:cytochrome c biogenesis protein CcsA [Candidatus Polarisedimenticola svalbardensis]